MSGSSSSEDDTSPNWSRSVYTAAIDPATFIFFSQEGAFSDLDEDEERLMDVICPSAVSFKTISQTKSTTATPAYLEDTASLPRDNVVADGSDNPDNENNTKHQSNNGVLSNEQGEDNNIDDKSKETNEYLEVRTDINPTPLDTNESTSTLIKVRGVSELADGDAESRGCVDQGKTVPDYPPGSLVNSRQSTTIDGRISSPSQKSITSARHLRNSTSTPPLCSVDSSSDAGEIHRSIVTDDENKGKDNLNPDVRIVVQSGTSRSSAQLRKRSKNQTNNQNIDLLYDRHKQEGEYNEYSQIEDCIDMGTMKIDAEHQVYHGILPDTIDSKPPIGHFSEFSKSAASEEASFLRKNQFQEEASIFECSLFTSLSEATQITEDPATGELSREHAIIGSQIMDTITEIPLSSFWHIFSQILVLSVFVTNVIVGIYDVFINRTDDGGYVGLHYKVPTIILGVLENIILVALWIILRSSSKDKKKLKHQQYVENIVHEILLYPLICVSVFGFSTEKMYNKPSEVMGWIQLALLAFDTYDLLVTQIMRIYMVYSFVKDMNKVLPNDYKVPGHILVRLVMTSMSNILILVLLILMLGSQVHDDNYESENYEASMRSSILLIALCIVPFLNILMFIMSNFYWIMELMLYLTVKSSEDEGFSEILRGNDLGDMLGDALDIAKAKSAQVKQRLKKIHDASTLKRIVAIAFEPGFMIVFIIYEVIIILTLLSFGGCEKASCEVYYVQLVFMAASLITNLHAVLITLVIDIVLAIFLLAMIAYPFLLPIILK